MIEVKEYKGVAYFKDYKDARAHMEKYAPDVSASRIVDYTHVKLHRRQPRQKDRRARRHI
jgi:hypothetical protein